MKFYFVFLLLIDGSSFFFLGVFPVLYFVDDWQRTAAACDWKQSALFAILCLHYKHFGNFGKGGHYFRKRTLRNLVKRFLYSFGIWIYVTIFLAVEKVTTIYQCVTFLHNVLGHSLYILCGCPSISVRPQRKDIFGIYFPFSWLIRLQLFFRSSTQRRLFDLWKQYEEGHKNTKQLLEACSHLVNPL